MSTDGFYAEDYVSKNVVDSYHLIRDGQDIFIKFILDAIEDFYKSTTGVDKVPPLEHLIDIGCGSGTVTVMLAKHFMKITAVDISETQIDKAKLSFSHSNIEYKVGSAESIPVDDECADVITSVFSAYYFDMESFVRECRRVLKPRGVAVLYGHEIVKVFPGKDFVIGASAEPDATQLWRKTLAEAQDCAIAMKHPTKYLLDRYQAIYDQIKGMNKSRDDSKSYAKQMTLAQMRSNYSSIAFYTLEKPASILNKFWKGLKGQWKVEDKDDDEIIVNLTHKSFLLSLSK